MSGPALGLLTIALAAAAAGAGPRVDAPSPRVPLAFEPNLGQFDRRVRFVARAVGGTAFLTDDGFTVALRGGAQPVRFRLASSQPTRPEGAGPTGSVSRYFLGNDPRRWRSDVPSFGRVRYPSVYPGVDLLVEGASGDLAFDFELARGADPGRIAFSLEADGPAVLDCRGVLRVRTGGRQVQIRPPAVAGAEGSFRLRGPGLFGFERGGAPSRVAWAIDPVLADSTYLGGNGSDSIHAIAQDTAGNLYVAGRTTSTNFPTANSLEPYDAGYDAFFSKLDPAGHRLLYSTYLGGGANDSALAVAVDPTGAVYVGGQTGSGDFPTLNAFQSSDQGQVDGFIAKFNPNGTSLTLGYSTYLGTPHNDSVNALAVDDAGYLYVAGCAGDGLFPIWLAYQPGYRGGNADAFLARLHPNGPADQTAPSFSTLLGGNGFDCANAVALDGQGNVHIAGYSQSTNFPLLSPLAGQTALGGLTDGFIASFSVDGQTLKFSSYLGGSLDDQIYALGTDSAGDIFVAGETHSSDFPFLPDAGLKFGGYLDGFVAKVAPGGGGLLYSLPLGGDGASVMNAVAVSPLGVAVVGGSTSSSQGSLPLLNTLQDRKGTSDAWIVMVQPTGNSLVFSTLLGGSADESAAAVLLSDGGTVVVAGATGSADFPLSNAFQTTFKDGGRTDAGPLTDGYVARIFLPPPTITALTPDSGSTAGNTAVDLTGTNFLSPAAVLFGGVAASSVVPVGATGTDLRALTPSHDAGRVDVTVVNADGQQATLPGAFTYLALSVAVIAPAAQTVDAGQMFTLDGTGSYASPGASLTAGSFAWSQPGGPSAAPLDGGAFQAMTLSQPGTYLFALQVTDSAGVTSLPASAQVVVSGPPSLVPGYRFCGCGTGSEATTTLWLLGLLLLLGRSAPRFHRR